VSALNQVSKLNDVSDVSSIPDSSTWTYPLSPSRFNAFPKPAKISESCSVCSPLSIDMV
jgi:hypothetical protein